MAGYFNRDMPEAFKGWCAGCLPVQLPQWWEVAKRYNSAEAHVEGVHAKPQSEFSHLAWEDAMDKATTPCTPDGYAYTPWTVGVACDKCGKDI